MFVEVSLIFVKEVEVMADSLKFMRYGEEIRIDCPKSLCDLGLKNNSIIEVLENNEKNQIINVIFNYQGKSFFLSANINESFKNIALILSNEIGVNIDDLDFYYNNAKLDTDSYNKNFRELGLNDYCIFNVFNVVVPNLSNCF